MPHWRPTHYTLLVEHRWCDLCCSVYTCPAPAPRVTLRAGTTTRTISLDEFAKLLSMEGAYTAYFPTLPHRIEEVRTTLKTCPTCFNASPASQADLFPTPAPRALTVASIMATRRAHEHPEPPIIPATADDI